VCSRRTRRRIDKHTLDRHRPRNRRNGHSGKSVLTGTGKLDLRVPRDRQARFEPQLIAKYRRRFPDFDDKVVSLYVRGTTVREIQGHLRELYDVEVSPDLSLATDAVLESLCVMTRHLPASDGVSYGASQETAIKKGIQFNYSLARRTRECSARS